MSQWKKDNEKAKGFYDEIINNVKSSFQQTVALTKLRLEEVNGSKELEYNLKTFLDIALSKENSRFDMSKTGLRASAYKVKKRVKHWQFLLRPIHLRVVVFP